MCVNRFLLFNKFHYPKGNCHNSITSSRLEIKICFFYFLLDSELMSSFVLSNFINCFHRWDQERVRFYQSFYCMIISHIYVLLLLFIPNIEMVFCLVVVTLHLYVIAEVRVSLMLKWVSLKSDKRIDALEVLATLQAIWRIDFVGSLGRIIVLPQCKVIDEIVD